MFDLSLFNVEKLIQHFIFNLNTKLRTYPCKRLGKVQFISQVDKTLQVRKELMSITEKIKDAAAEEHFDISDEESVQQFVERKINFFDKNIQLTNSHPLSFHLRNINRSILHKMTKSKRQCLKDTKKAANIKVIHKSSNNKSKSRELKPSSDQERYCCSPDLSGKVKQLKEKKPVSDDPKLYTNNMLLRHKHKSSAYPVERKKLHSTYSPRHEKEIRSTARFLSLCMKDDEFKKRNVHITLYISRKELDENNSISDVRRNEIVFLCQRAILCLIEPSEKAFVLLKDDLSTIIKNHLSQGYKRQFHYQSERTIQYSALLVLSRWAKILVKDLNTTLTRTICGILSCDLEHILILSCSQDAEPHDTKFCISNLL